MTRHFSFSVKTRLPGMYGRSGVMMTPHGAIHTPAFIPVGTQATVKSLTPEQISSTGAQAVLANAYHLYLRPGNEIIRNAGGLHRFMQYNKPTFTDSGGFQVMSLGVGFKKVIEMEVAEMSTAKVKKEKLAWIDNDGVTFKSHLDGSRHRFTPEISMKVQHDIGADIIFSFDELTTLHDTYEYQKESLKDRTHPWALRSLTEHQRLSHLAPEQSQQALFGVIQGAQYEDLRRESARFLGSQDFDGYGLGGALTKSGMGDIVRWMCEELPESKPRHMLGIADPIDIFSCIENGADTFDCVSPARLARNGSIYTPSGRITVTNARYKNDHTSLTDNCSCYSCTNFSKAYLHHLLKTGEMLGATLATIHNEQFIVELVDDIRRSIDTGSYNTFKQQWLANYYHKASASTSR